jgi:hypothetical protein
MPTRRRIVVLGTMGNVPFAGMSWMHGQFLLGLKLLGHDVSYIEVTAAWPYLPAEQTVTDNPAFTLAYLDRIMRGFGMPDQWAYRTTYSDNTWHGPLAGSAEELIRSADAVFNITGSTTPEELGIPCRLVYIGTDPVIQEVKIANGDRAVFDRLAAHSAHFSYGENIGTPRSPLPKLPFTTYPMRQPVVMDMWAGPPPSHKTFTTITNWAVTGYDITWQGETYTWSKHHEYLKIIDLPKHTNAELELAMGMAGLSDDVKKLLEDNGWIVVDAYSLSQDPWSYRDYIRNSFAEVSVAKDMVVRTRSGWFSERSANYLAAGRPVITQDTGFSDFLPTGEGLFAFSNRDEILTAIQAVQADYDRHSRAARSIAEDYFKAEKVLGEVLGRLGL